MESIFDLRDLDPDDPFEIDAANRPHLFKHAVTQGGAWIALGEQDVYDVFFGQPAFRPADHGPAHWLMIGEVPGGLVLVVPLAPSRAGDADRCRPIGVYAASAGEQDRYRAWQRGEETPHD